MSDITDNASYDSYEAFMGRWSRHIATQFLEWVAPQAGKAWLDVGCGAGMLAQSIVENYAPESVMGVDPLEASIDHARAHEANAGISFNVGDAQDLPFEDSAFDIVVSGLMIKFVPDKLRAVSEMKRVSRPGGTVALYDWDMGGDKNTTRHFWRAITDIAPELMKGRASDRPPMTETATVADKFREAGLTKVEERNFVFTGRYTNFEDYWYPATHNVQNVGRFYQKLSPDQRIAVHDRLKQTLPFAADGSISFESEASAVIGNV